jgi:hypothetical protein
MSPHLIASAAFTALATLAAIGVQAQPGPAARAASGPRMPMQADMDKQMKAMQEMHEKMAAAKTPGERQALMSEHMKVMREGMSMMGRMGGMGGMGGMGPRDGAGGPGMHERMRMMEHMMQMMMDRLEAMPPAK